jgi:flagellum-specific peptidoglycan hydrolase FlgJ
MIRFLRLALMAGLVLFGFGAAPAMAQQSATQKLAADDSTPTQTHKKTAKAKSAKSAKAKTNKNAAKKAAHKSEASDNAGDVKPTQIASFGDWGAFLAEDGKGKTCYVLAQPQKRDPSKLKRDPAYVFISNRPRENIHNEVSIMMGFPMKDGGDAEADVAGTSFDLVSKGTNAWIKNPAQEAEFIATLKKSAKLVVKANSLKGHLTTDSYSLAGLSLALARAEKECR